MGAGGLLPPSSPQGSDGGSQNPAPIPAALERPPHLTPQCTWAVCPFSPAPPSPTASLPQLSLSLLLDVIYSGNAESDKPRLPRQKQWQRPVQGRQPSLDNVLRRRRGGGAPGGAGGSSPPFLPSAPGPRSSLGSLGPPDPFSNPHPASWPNPVSPDLPW